MNQLFDIEKFNIISDDENYYFFRSLEPGDLQDIENGIINTNNGYTRLRTDRERWKDQNPSENPRWNEESQISLEEMFNHIKVNYNLQTNCISLSSNANVAKTYEETFSDKYVVIRVPKKEMGERVFHAGQYMLTEIERLVNEYIDNNDINEGIMRDLKEIDESKTSEEIQDIIKTKYKANKPLDTSKVGMRNNVIYKAPFYRISSFQSLSEEQSLEKNKIIGKLTILETRAGMKPIISHTKDNNFLITTMGSAFASSEQIYYGDIDGDRVKNIQREMLNIFSLVQQVEGIDTKIIDDLKRELIEFVYEGKTIEISDNGSLLRNDKVRENISIEEMYELTGGKVEYGAANSIVRNIFYLAKSQSNARELARILNEITGNNPKYQEIIKYIEENGFEIEQKITSRHHKYNYKLSESVGLTLRANEIPLIEDIKKLTLEEQIEILENGGLSNVKEIMSKNFSSIQSEEKISKDRYYAEAIISSYNWKEIGIAEFSITQKNELIQRLIDNNCIDICNKLKDAGVEESNIANSLINLVTKEKFRDIMESENYKELIQENINELQQKLSIDQMENFLGYYDVDGTEIKLRDYQKDAVDKTDEIFTEKKFASVILPTGAGKSFVAITELLKHKDEPIIYFAPQNEILEQMKNYIIKYVHGTKNTLSKSKDEIIKEIFPNIKFETYPSLLSKNGKQTIKEKYGFIILDELHRTGAKEWEGKLNKLIENQDENVKVLGITATPTRDADFKNMAHLMAYKLGYTREEIEKEKHIAIDMDLIKAIKLGLVVNPKLVTCEYTLKNDGSMEKLLEQINSITEETERNKKKEQYENLRRNLEHAEGISEILKANIKEGGRYLVYIPVTEQWKTEDSQKLNTRIDEQKIIQYEKYIQECFKNSGINTRYFSMLGSYTNKKNKEQIEAFESDRTSDVKFMIVMDKANEGLHIENLDGIVWFRALDENSKILYLQQLGRIIYAEDPNNPTQDDKRPIIIDLANNTLKVNLNKELKTNNEKDDLELLTIILDWADKHNALPDIESTSRKEKIYAGTLNRIYNKYKKYAQNGEHFAKLDDDKKEQVEQILDKGYEVDLWDLDLPQISDESEIEKSVNIDSFELNGIMKDYLELNNGLQAILERTVVSRTLDVASILNANNIDLKKVNLSVRIGQKNHPILLKEIEQKGIDIEKIIKENGLDPNFEYGKNVRSLRAAYNGNGKGILITDDEKIEAKRLGLIPEKEKSMITETLEVVRILKENNVDVKNIQLTIVEDGKQRPILLKDIKQESIDIDKIIKENGLSPDFKYGSKLQTLRQAYRGTARTTMMTQLERQETEELELVPTKRRIVPNTINIARVLINNGIDIQNFPLARKVNGKLSYTLLKEIKQEGIDINRIIEENDLNPNFKIGRNLSMLRDSYNGTSKTVVITDDERRELEQLGLIRPKEKTRISQVTEVAKVLNNNGVNLEKIKINYTHNGEKLQIKLKEIEQEGIDINKIIEENGLNPDFEYGKYITTLRLAYRGTTSLKITDEEKQEAQLLGLIPKKKKSLVAETIEIARILKSKGLNLETIKLNKMVNGKNHQILLKEIEQEGIDIDTIIQETGLNPNFTYGKNVSDVRQAYKGTRKCPITDIEKKEVESLGLLNMQISGQDIGQASFDANEEKCDEAQEVLNNLLEKSKEGEIVYDREL